MYQVADSQVVVTAGRMLRRRRAVAGVSRTVVLLGLTSMFTDVSSEMVTTILPLYLVYSLGLSPLQFGVIDGVQQGASSLVRLAAAFTADKLGRHKETAVLGYGLSAACRVLFLVAGRAWALIGLAVFLDRTGKGIRTAPRDAMISLSVPKEHLGTAFGIHRAMDTAGAVIGPLIAFSLLLAIPQGFDSVFVVSLCFALIGLAILVLFVDRSEHAPAREEVEPITAKDVARLLRVPGFPALLAAGGALALTTMSDGFVYLGLQKNLGFAGRDLPLLFVATSLVYMLLAVPAGRLADRIGRARVFVGGYALLLVVYAALVLPPLGPPAALLVIVAFGAYYAATDGVLAALSSSLLPAASRASGRSIVVTATSVGRLFASIAFGAAWELFGVRTAVLIFAGALVVAVAFAAAVLGRQRSALHA
jgi:MFS family permease